MDKRIKRSKEKLKTCFIQLINEKAFNEITVTELCYRAGVNRSTFYAHYLDILDLQESIQRELYDEFDKTLKNYLHKDSGWFHSLLKRDTEESLPILKEIFIYIKKHQDIFRHFFTASSDLKFLDHFFERGREHFLMTIKETVKEPNIRKLNYYYTYVASGTLGLMKDWVAGGFRETPEELEKLAIEFITEGLQKK